MDHEPTFGDRQTCRSFELRQFFPTFLGFIDHMVDTKFLPAAHRHSISVDADPRVLIDKLRSYARVDVPKWL